MAIQGSTVSLALGEFAPNMLTADADAPLFTSVINATYSPTGSIEKRAGYSSTGGYSIGAANSPIGGIGVMDAGGIAVTQANGIYRLSAPSTDISASKLSGSERRPRMAEYLEKMIITKGGNVPLVPTSGNAAAFISKPATPTVAMTAAKSYGNPLGNNGNGTVIPAQLSGSGPGTTKNVYTGTYCTAIAGSSIASFNYIKAQVISVPFAGDFTIGIYEWYFGVKYNNAVEVAKSYPVSVTGGGEYVFNFSSVVNLSAGSPYIIAIAPVDFAAYGATATNPPRFAIGSGLVSSANSFGDITGGYDVVTDATTMEGDVGGWSTEVVVPTFGIYVVPNASAKYDINLTGALASPVTIEFSVGGTQYFPEAWLTRNNTTGGQTLTATCTGATGTVDITSGTWRLQVSDSGVFSGVQVSTDTTIKVGFNGLEAGIAYDIKYQSGLSGSYEYTYSAYDSATDAESGVCVTATLVDSITSNSAVIVQGWTVTTDSVRIYRRPLDTDSWFLLGTFKLLDAISTTPGFVDAAGGALVAGDYSVAVVPRSNGGTGYFGARGIAINTLSSPNTKFTASWTGGSDADYYSVMLRSRSSTDYYYREFETSSTSIVFDGITSGPAIGGLVTAHPSYTSGTATFFVDNVPNPTITFLEQVDPAGAKWCGVADDMAVFAGYSSHAQLTNPSRSFFRTEPGTTKILSSYYAELPDELIGMEVVGREIYFFMRREIHIWQNLGATSDMPFARVQTIRRGLWFNAAGNVGASDSIVRANGALFWIADDGDAYTMSGFDLKRITYPKIKRRLLELLRQQTSMLGLHGHDCLHENKIRWVFETPAVTLVYDYLNDKWSEDYIGTASPPVGQFPINSYAYIDGVPYMGDLNATGSVYRMDKTAAGASIGTDDGAAINHYRRFSYKFKTQSGQANNCMIQRIRVRAMMLDQTTKETTQSFTATLKWRFDKGPTFATATLTWPNQDSAHAQPYTELYQLGTGREVEFILEETATATYPMVVTDMDITYKELGR